LQILIFFSCGEKNLVYVGLPQNVARIALIRRVLAVQVTWMQEWAGVDVDQ
jgi:hypothetical protein